MLATSPGWVPFQRDTWVLFHSDTTDMQAFIETVSSQWLQERLWTAIRGRGAFRRFKDVLAGAPAERERWFAFKGDRLRQRVLAWLADEGIEPAEGSG